MKFYIFEIKSEINIKSLHFFLKSQEIQIFDYFRKFDLNFFKKITFLINIKFGKIGLEQNFDNFEEKIFYYGYFILQKKIFYNLMPIFLKQFYVEEKNSKIKFNYQIKILENISE